MLSDVSTPQNLDERFREELAALAGPDQRRDLGEPVAPSPVPTDDRTDPAGDDTPAAPDPAATGLPPQDPLTGARALELFQAQVVSRQLDLAGRWLYSFGEGFHTTASAGHEGNAAVAAALRPTDPALLHYRSGAFYCYRAGQVATDPATDPAAAPPADGPAASNPGGPVTSSPDGPAPGALDGSVVGVPDDPAAIGADDAAATASGGPHGPPSGVEVGAPYLDAARDVLRGMVASAREPLAGGRDKVFGRADLNLVPVTATAATHLPRAVGLGLALERLRRVDVSADQDARTGPDPSAGTDSDGPGGDAGGGPWPPDAIVVASFGDAAVNHASATTALNTAGWCDHTGLRVPILFVCEDNGLGSGVRSPRGWVEQALRSRPGVRYFAADGTDLEQTYRVAGAAAAWVRRHRRPAVLHLDTVRLMGHEAEDDTGYRAAAEIDADLARDPLLATARALVAGGFVTAEDLLSRYDEAGWQVRRLAEEVIEEPKLAEPTEVLSPLAPRRPVRVSRAVADAAARAAGPNAAARAEAFGGKPPELAGPLTLAESINAALTDGMLAHPQMAVFGQDVAARGGLFGVTEALRDRFGPARVFDTLLDETSILGLGLGAGLAGLLPVPEIQHLSYLHHAEDQLRQEAAALQFLSQGALRNPMVVRVAGLAYQEGPGGPTRNDNAVGILRDVPGLVVAVPARPDDAAPMLRTCLASAVVDGTVAVFLEPGALYQARDLYTDGDGEWLGEYAEPAAWSAGHVPIGRARVYGVGSAEDLTIVTFGNGVRLSLRAAATLADEGFGSRVVDLRWLAPLPVADLIREASATGRVLVVDETRRTGGVGEGVIAALVDAGYVGAVRRVAAVDSFVPLGPAARQVLVSEDAITQGARTLLAR
ncbi:transketolase C-terminal domain-containing protein [Micromonospora sp. SH-82]|uniref:transketolase C-terminal domain-containing protein n=1 Tax=Micromonospora sp. SH-82 TaxID=3132938 RepID=UPI003EBA7244